MDRYYTISFDCLNTGSDLSESNFLKTVEWKRDDGGIILVKTNLDLPTFTEGAERLKTELGIHNIKIDISTAFQYFLDRSQSMSPFMHKGLYPSSFVENGFWSGILLPGNYILEVAVLPLLSERGTLRMTAPYLPLQRKVLDYLKRRAQRGEKTKLLLREGENEQFLQNLRNEISSFTDLIAIRYVTTGGANYLHAKLVIVEGVDRESPLTTCLSTSYNFTDTQHYENAILYQEQNTSILERFDYIWDNSRLLEPVAQRSRILLPKDANIMMYYKNMDMMILNAENEGITHQRIQDIQKIDVQKLKSRLTSEGTRVFYGKEARICNAIIVAYAKGKLNFHMTTVMEKIRETAADETIKSKDMVELFDKLIRIPLEDEADKNTVYKDLPAKKAAHRQMVAWMRSHNFSCLFEPIPEIPNEKKQNRTEVESTPETPNKKRHVEIEGDQQQTLYFRAAVNQVPKDGNCLFSAIQLGDKSTVREVAVDWIENHLDDDLWGGCTYRSYIEKEKQCKANTYIANMRRTGVWGGLPELCALATLAGLRLRVFEEVSSGIFKVIASEFSMGGDDKRDVCLRSDHFDTLSDICPLTNQEAKIEAAKIEAAKSERTSTNPKFPL